MPLGQVDPAVQPQAKGGEEARGKVIAGLALAMIRIAIPKFSKESDLAIVLSEVSAKLGKQFQKPEEDMGLAELKFMQSQLFPGQRPQAMDMGGNIQQKMQGMGIQGPGAPAPMMAGAGAPQGGM
mgnify:CR=1 FL=1